ncbi:MAG: FtsX-like permease family protein [Burkholderiales bacterium]
MNFLKLIFRNAFRHKLRTGLTIFGIVVAILAFGLLQTVVTAFYAGANAASNTRLVARNAISLTFSLPISYRARIKGVDGVTSVGYANWFGGIYQEPKNFFPQFAIDGATYLDLYPEYKLTPAERDAFLRDRRGCIVGRKLADTFGFKIGDVIPIKGTIFPGKWEFVVRGIFEGAEAATNTSQLLFHWDYLNETLLKTIARRANYTGVYIVGITSGDRAAEISRAVDEQFRNSLAETLTETEKSFQLGFVSMSDQIVAAIRVVSFVVILIILAVVANTMAMTARERLSEYATLKALGFGPSYVAALIFGESLALAFIGCVIGIALTFPMAQAFASAVGTMFPVFSVSDETVQMQILCAIAVGILAAIVPGRRAATVKIVDGLRSIA